MAHDPYAPCICGSGKKLKFCCLDILSDMQRVEKLRDNQPDAAEKLLTSLYETHPDREVLVAELSELLTESGRRQEARDLCVDFLKRHPDEPRVLLIVAELYLDEEGFEGSRRIAHRALQLAGPAEATRIAMLLTKLGMLAFRSRNYASSYAHLDLAFRYAPPDMYRHIEMLMGAWTMGQSDSWPWMGPMDLLDINVTDELREMDRKARKLHTLGCWEPSAILYARMIKQDPENGPLWNNLGLFQLWDNRPREAAASLQKAAMLLDDPDAAAEAQALGWLLELETGPDQRKFVRSSCDVASESVLIDRLLSDNRIRRVERGQETAQQSGPQEFNLIDPDAVEPDGAMPLLANIIVVSDQNAPGALPTASVYAKEDQIDQVWNIFKETAGDGVAPDAVPSERTVTDSTPSLFSCLDWRVHFDFDVTGTEHRQRLEKRVQNSVNHWLEMPFELLQGKTLREVASDPAQRVPAAAAVLLLQIGCQRAGHELDPDRVRDDLGIPQPAAVPIAEDRSIESVPHLHAFRLSLPDLTDMQIVELAERATSTYSLTLTRPVTEELIGRPQALELFSPRRAHLLRAAVARYFGNTDMLSEAFAAARETAPPEADAFQYRLELDLKELTYRLDDPQDPQLPHLLDSLRDQYFRKIPEIADLVANELTRRGCDHLLSHATAAISTGIVLPDDEEAKPTGKLWLPGQE